MIPYRWLIVTVAVLTTIVRTVFDLSHVCVQFGNSHFAYCILVVYPYSGGTPSIINVGLRR